MLRRERRVALRLEDGSTLKSALLVGADGAVFGFGDAAFYGSAARSPVAAPVSGMCATPSGKGYWLVGKDGGVFALGDATFSGSITSPSQCAETNRSDCHSGHFRKHRHLALLVPCSSFGNAERRACTAP